VLFERVEQSRGEAEIAFLEILGVCGAVDACEVENEIRLSAIPVEPLGSGVYIVFKDALNREVREAAVLAVLYGVKLGAKVLAHETFRAGY